MNIRKRLSETGQDKCPYCRSANIRVTFLAFFEKDRNLMGDETIQSVHCCSCGRPIPETTSHIPGVVSFMDVLSESRAMGVSLLRKQALAALVIADSHLTPESSAYVRRSVIRTAIAEELESEAPLLPDSVQRLGETGIVNSPGAGEVKWLYAGAAPKDFLLRVQAEEPVVVILGSTFEADFEEK